MPTLWGLFPKKREPGTGWNLCHPSELVPLDSGRPNKASRSPIGTMSANTKMVAKPR